jgi:signal peptidase I
VTDQPPAGPPSEGGPASDDGVARRQQRDAAAAEAADAGAATEVDGVAAPKARAQRKAAKSSTRNALEWVAVIGGAIIIAVVVRTFILQTFWIPSPSMSPTLVENDRVLVNKLAYRFHDVNRGDVVVFERPPNEPPSEIKDLIKRVVGLPGDIVATRDGAVWINGRRLTEPYLPGGTPSTGLDDGVKIPTGHVWVMGDNRTNSADSRVFGPLSERLVIGRAFARVWPPSRIGFL